jgi:hypothetical protein
MNCLTGPILNDKRLLINRKEDKIMFRRIIMTVVVICAIAVVLTGFIQYA